MSTHEGLDTASRHTLALRNDTARRGLDGNPGRGDVRGSNDGNATFKAADPYALGDALGTKYSAKPANIAAVDAAGVDGEADVTWDALASAGAGVQGYNVYVQVAQAGAYVKNNVAVNTDTSYTTTGLNAGTHNVKVRAVDENGTEFSESAVDAVTTT